MPKMNGVEMLESIRELDSEVPIIYTTARTESEYLLRAIELNVNHYVLKPIDTEDIIMRVQKVCEKKYYENMIQSKNKELAQYLEIIDHVAVIIKLDEEGKVLFANSLFLETSKYESSEIIGKTFNSLIHEKTASIVIDVMWEKLGSGETWHADIKYEDKEKNAFFVNSTIIQVTSDIGNEYVNIGFLSTAEVNEKREFHKKIIKNIQQSNIKAFESKTEIEQLKHKDGQLELIISQLQNDLVRAKTKNKTIKNQLEQHESDLLNIDRRIENGLKIKNKEIQNHQELITSLKKEKEVKTNTNQKLMEDLDASKTEIDKMYDGLKRKDKRIETLTDLLEYREAQLREINPEFVL